MRVKLVQESSTNNALTRNRLTYIIFSIIKFEATKYHTNKRKADGAASGGSSAKKAKVSKKSKAEEKNEDQEQDQDQDQDQEQDEEELDQELLDQASSDTVSPTKPKSKASTAKKATAAPAKAKAKATPAKKTTAKPAAKSTVNKAFKPPAVKAKVTKVATPPPEDDEEANDEEEFEGPSEEDLEGVEDKAVDDTGGDTETETISKVLDDVKAHAGREVTNTAPKGFEIVGVQAAAGLRKESRPSDAEHLADLGKAGLKAATAPSASSTPKKELSTIVTSSPAVAAAEQVEDDTAQVFEEIANSIEVDHDSSSVIEERPRIRRLTDLGDTTKVHRSIFNTRTDTPTDVSNQPLAQPIFTPTPKFTSHINVPNTISISVTLLKQSEETANGMSYIMALPSSVSFAEVLGKYMLQLPQGHADYQALAGADKCVLRTADGIQQNFSIREAYVEKMWKAAVGRALRGPDAESGLDVLEVEIS